MRLIFDFFKDVIIQTFPEKKIVCYRVEVLTSLIIYREFNGTCDVDKHIRITKVHDILDYEFEYTIACTGHYDKLIESIQ